MEMLNAQETLIYANQFNSLFAEMFGYFVTAGQWSVSSRWWTMNT